MLCFSLLGINSLAKILMIVMIIVSVVLSPLNLRPLHKLDPEVYFTSAALLLLYGLVNLEEISGMVLLQFPLSLFFILHSVDIVRSLLLNMTRREKQAAPRNTARVSRLELSIIAVTSILIITFFSTSSPLYAFNYWDDTNIYFTVGRGIRHGLVPYRDLFEQKGPYFLFMYALCAFISDSSFLGIYLFELVACFIFWLFAWKTVLLFYKPSRFSLILIPLSATLTYLVIPFHFGGSAEEFSLPFLSAVVYIASRAEKKRVLPKPSEALIIGIISGLLFFTKFTTCSLILGYIIYVIYRAISGKEAKKLPRLILFFLLGFALTWIPVLIYFAVNGAVGDLLKYYLYNNLFSYSTGGNFKYRQPLKNINSLMTVSEYTYYGIVLAIFASAGMRKNYRILFYSILISMFVAIYAPSMFLYYYPFVLTVTVIPALVLVSVLLDSFISRLENIGKPLRLAAVLSIAAVLSASFCSQRNFSLLGIEEETLPQYELGKIISSTPDASLLTYDVMDAGFFLYGNTLPDTFNFCFTNTVASNPEFREGQEKLIEEGHFDYIIALSDEYEWDNYEIIASSYFRAPEDIQISIDEEKDFTYYLYARR